MRFLAPVLIGSTCLCGITGAVGKDHISNAIGMTFVQCPAGTFNMGSSKGRTDEQPVHSVKINNSFYMQTTTVTQSQWKRVMGSNPSRRKGDNLPVTNINWFEVQTFIEKLNRLEPGMNYRLPTEAEWEYACRANDPSETGGDLDEVSWNVHNSGNQPHPVGLKRPNAFGLYDMLGNVSQWCLDWKGLYEAADQVDPVGPSTGTRRVDRGGSWRRGIEECRAAARDDTIPEKGFDALSFRLVCKSALAISTDYRDRPNSTNLTSKGDKEAFDFFNQMRGLGFSGDIPRGFKTEPPPHQYSTIHRYDSGGTNITLIKSSSSPEKTHSVIVVLKDQVRANDMVSLDHCVEVYKKILTDHVAKYKGLLEVTHYKTKDVIIPGVGSGKSYPYVTLSTKGSKPSVVMQINSGYTGYWKGSSQNANGNVEYTISWQ